MAEETPSKNKTKERYPLSRVIIGNILIILGIIVGTIAVWYFSPLVATAYLIIAVIFIYFILRKIVCTNCYYYDKWCSMGWGKLASLLFKRGNIEQFNETLGIRLAPIVYAILTIFPLIVIVYVIIGEIDFYKVAVLVILVFFAVYSGSLSRKSACASCKMKDTCPGSAVKP